MAGHRTAYQADDAAGETEGVWDGVRIVDRDCPLCGDANPDAPGNRYSLAPWKVADCRSCGFTYITTAPVYEALVSDLSWEKTSDMEAARRMQTRALQQTVSKRTRWRLALLPRKTMPSMLARHAAPGNVVDLGCGDGGQLAGLDRRFVPHGIEISAAAAAAADAAFRPHGGYAVNAPCLDGLQQLPTGGFSAATLRSYLEHEMQPAAVLREMHRVLADGGVAIVKVPNYASVNRRVMGRRWCGFRYPDHLNYFTPASLREMARRTGYSTRFGPTGRLPTSDNMWAILRKETDAA